MGCWNKTCGLSNLHIRAGDPVYVFVLEQGRDDSNCYSTSLFRPLLLPFLSEYNDYGGGENSSGAAFGVVMAALKEKLIEQELGENQYHDIAVKRDEFNEELFFEAVHENRLFVPGWRGDPTPVSFTMFRKDIVDNILENRVIEWYVGDGKGTGGWGNNYNYLKFADIASSVPALVKRLAEEIQTEEGSFRFYIMESLHRYRKEFIAAEWMSDDYRFSRIVDLRILMSDMLKEGKVDEVIALATEHVRAVFIERFMNDTRKTWIPGGHEGSQSAASSAHRLLANSVLQALDKEKADWLADNEGDEDEYMEE